MFSLAIVFLLFALVAAAFGFGGLAGESASLARILAGVGIVLAVATFFFGRRPRRL